ncbi:MAG: hypothetical protein V4563_15085 [Pseudomonadota bacterium]
MAGIEEIAHIVPGVLDDAARRAYAKAFDAKRDTTGGLGDMEQCLETAMLFDVVVGGEVVARYALRQVARAKGVEVFVVAAAGGLKGVDLVAAIGPYIERQCATADRLTINTRRPGLVRKMQAQGWTLDSYVMRKKL